MERAIEEIETSFYRVGAAAVRPAQQVKDTEATMNTRQNVKSSSSISEQFNLIDMSLEKRSAALRDAFVAELIVDAITWVCKQVGRLGGTGFAKPSPKY